MEINGRRHRTFAFRLGNSFLRRAVCCVALWSAAARAAEPPTAAQLVERLASSDYSVREAAQRKLQAMGAAAKPDLLAGANGADVEQRLRVDALLREIRRTELWEPSYVSSEKGDLSVVKALEETARQSGNKINWERSPKGFDDKIRLQLPRRTYWETLDDICRKANVAVQFYEDPGRLGCVLNRGSPGKYPTAYAGPLRLRLQSLRRSLHQELHFGDGVADTQDSLTASLQLHWEQRVALCRYSGRPSVLEARTDSDEDLRLQRRTREFTMPVARRLREVQYSVNLAVPTKPATKLTRFRLAIEAEIAGDFVELAIPLKDAGGVADADGYRLHLEQLKRDASGTTCVVRLHRAEPSDSQQNLPDLVDESFSIVVGSRALPVTTLKTVGTRSSVQYTFTLSGSVDPAAQVRCSAPRLRSRRVAEFLFENVPMLP
jgi:hypothetical protein